MDEKALSVSVRFEPLGVDVDVPVGLLLADAAAQAGIRLQMPCGGEGLCGKCRVRLLPKAAPASAQPTADISPQSLDTGLPLAEARDCTEEKSLVSGSLGLEKNDELLAAPTAQEKRHFSADQLAAGWRLACQVPVLRPLLVEVPETSLAQAAAKILVAGQTLANFPIDPPVVKRFVVLPPPSRQDDAPDLDRLAKALETASTELVPPDEPIASARAMPKAKTESLRVDWPLLRQLPDRLRQYGFQGTAVLAGEWLLDFEPGDTTDQHYGVAVDIGTTTMAAALIHLPTGRQLAVQAELNPQTAFGDDVISRISYAQRSPDHLEELRSAVIGAIDRMIGQLAEQVGIKREQIYYTSLVGNTTMQHLACGITPQYLGQVPFTPAAGDSLVGQAAGLGLRIHPAGLVYVAPVIGGYVGGDIVAGMVAVGLAGQDRPTLFLDIGTNGEIVLAAGGRLFAAATAAGPAFEGARICHGMRAAPGAIERIHFDGQWHIRTVGNQRPKGICGSALIDLAAELLRLGLVRPDGRLVPTGPEDRLQEAVREGDWPESFWPKPDSSPAQLPSSARVADLAQRWTQQHGEPAFVICPAEQSATGRPILLTQRDVRQLQLAAGAIRTGIQMLLRRAGLQVRDLEAVWVAGAFGTYIRRRNAQRIGLLPPELPAERIRFLGNTALAGARLLVLSRQAQTEASRLARSAQHIDLAAEPDFAALFAEAMCFPEGHSLPSGDL
ncbi:MAG: ASKHA domain-containing protein [Thermoguttaceae bacterium]|nr:ASKHA domain-containing protein [Thermoguttaceae bacterium]MDW8038592.1 ASKHA domain-containing protein [Thermoguttaceae bacterium]